MLCPLLVLPTFGIHFTWVHPCAFVHADTAVCCHAMWNLVLVTSCKIISCNDRNHLTSRLPSYVNVPMSSCCFWIKGPTAEIGPVKQHQNEWGSMQPGQLLFTARLRERRGTSQGRPVPCSFVGWYFGHGQPEFVQCCEFSPLWRCSPDTVFARHPCGAAPWLNMFLLIASS